MPSVLGYRIIYLRLLDFDSKNFNFNDVVRTFMMVFDLWQYEEGTWPGYVSNSRRLTDSPIVHDDVLYAVKERLICNGTDVNDIYFQVCDDN